MYDCIVIGAGIAGAIAARKLAEEAGKKVLVIERRNHIGGNCYDVADAHGILIHEYGPHIFHTGIEEVYTYLSRFTEWYPFGHEVVAKVGGELIPVPFNLNTLHMVYDKEKADRLEQKLIAEYGEGSRVPIMKLRENEDADIREIAQYVYENVFLKYTMKQWGQKPEEISPEVTGRVPVLISYDNRYFQDKYQGVPKYGFTPMFEKMLDHENIEVWLNTDCNDVLSFVEDEIYFEGEAFDGDVIYTGALDELFDCCYGRLPYRSLDFKFEHYDEDSYQGHSVVNYTVSEDFTRITEFKYLTGQQDAKGTTIVKEYPFAYTGAAGEIPYYAILNEENQALYEKYQALTAGMKKFHLLGRLAEYKYYNIDAMTKKAMELADMIMESGEEKMKLLTFAIPCYNSESYMRNCIESLLPGGDDVEIIIVDDGSTKDRTAEIADEYEKKYPGIVRAIHQENGGHGEAVNTGLRNATGLYFKVVDSDDWVDLDAYMKILDKLKELVGGEKTLDMLISNYVYEKEGAKHKKVMRYTALPKDEMITWKDTKFRKGQYILMHSVIYRTKLLRECGLELPKHTFYVDNIYVYKPLPSVKYMYYMDVDFYRYFIGRDDQSVNEKVMISRIDQQIKVNKIMVDAFDLWKLKDRRLQKYMFNYLEIITVVSTIMLIKSGTEENLMKKRELWGYIKDSDIRLFHHLRRGIMGNTMNLPGKSGRKISIAAYKISQKVVDLTSTSTL